MISENRYRIVFIDEDADYNEYPDILFQAVERMGWEYEKITLRGKEVKEEEYQGLLEKALSCIEEAASQPNYLVYNNALIDMLWDDGEGDEYKPEVDDILSNLMSDNIFNIICIERVRAIPESYAGSGPEKKKSEGYQDELAKYTKVMERMKVSIDVLKNAGANIKLWEYNPIHEWNVVSYVITNGLDFFDKLNDGWLRLYVPDEGYQAEQIDGFVRLFESYMNRIEKKEIRVETVRTGNGTIYTFHSSVWSTNEAQEGFPEAINRFDQFMALCKDDPDRAADLVIAIEPLPSDDARALVAKCARRYARLLVDIKHEQENGIARVRSLYEQRCREIQHQFEVDALELAAGESLISAPVSAPGLGATLLPTTSTTPLIVNVLDGSHESRALVQEIVETVTRGGKPYTPEQTEFVRAIRAKAINNIDAVSLESDLQVVNDDTAQAQTRRSALRRLNDFADRNKGTFADAALRAFTEGLTKLLGGM